MRPVAVIRIAALPHSPMCMAYRPPNDMQNVTMPQTNAARGGRPSGCRYRSGNSQIRIPTGPIIIVPSRRLNQSRPLLAAMHADATEQPIHDMKKMKVKKDMGPIRCAAASQYERGMPSTCSPMKLSTMLFEMGATENRRLSRNLRSTSYSVAKP